jgi:eukaryotic-like serine/threonine-protein kinase
LRAAFTTPSRRATLDAPMSLRTTDVELRDLAQGSPLLVDAISEQPTGAKLLRCIGAGGMSTVFLAEVDPAVRSEALSPLTPRTVAIKFLQIATQDEFHRQNLDPADVFVRETVALGRMMERKPPTEFVVGYYGCGHADVEVNIAAVTASPQRDAVKEKRAGEVRRLPWIAIEFVDGGPEGVTLSQRVYRATGEGVDPIRALRLLRGIIEGVIALHAEGILHRDIKPDNVLIAGPIDDEIPKLADCGIARVDGLLGTVAGMTPTYGGPEQRVSTHGERNPLVGPWTDVHALAAIAWFVLGGDDWCRRVDDAGWHQGARRGLRTAHRLHPALMSSPPLLDAIDAVLTRGASHRLPRAALDALGASQFVGAVQTRYPSMFRGIERYSGARHFAADLLPLLEECAAAWTSRAASQNRAATSIRSTQLRYLDERAATEPFARVRELPAAAASSSDPLTTPSVLAPGGAVFHPDGKVLARFGQRLLYIVGDRAHKVVIPDALRSLIGASRWAIRGPGGGFALIGPTCVLLVRGGVFSEMPLPRRAGGGEVGEIQAVVNSGRVFGVVTAETEDSGGPELWTSPDGATWAHPLILPLGGDARSVADGPYGFLVVGAGSRRGTRARALFLGFDGQAIVYTAGVNDRSPLLVGICGAGREAWGAGQGFILSFERGLVTAESTEHQGMPMAMALDLVGIPWLVCEHVVLRRHVDGERTVWRVYYQRGEERPPLIGVGFTPEGVRVLDAQGGGAHIVPRDIELWSSQTRIS